MIEFSESQRRAVASGLTALSAAIVLAFVSAVAWGVLKALSFASPALVPVIMGFFLSLFFKPYYQLWRRIVRNPTLALLVMLAYTLQIYFDFSGYSDMAIGLGKMFGFEFMKNFDYPYISASITEFWRRWHISLGTWFREYVYIPLGGNRHGLARQIINIGVVWFLTGLWHGASWNFILWGVYFGVLLVIEKSFLLKLLKKLPSAVGHIYAMILVVFGWVLFYFEDMGEMGRFIARLFGSDGFSMSQSVQASVISYLPLIVIAAVVSTPLFTFIYHKIKSKAVLAVIDNGACITSLLLCTSALVSSSYNPFLYFKF